MMWLLGHESRRTHRPEADDEWSTGWPPDRRLSCAVQAIGARNMSLQSVTVTHLGALQDVASMTVGPHWLKAFITICIVYSYVWKAYMARRWRRLASIHPNCV